MCHGAMVTIVCLGATYINLAAVQAIARGPGVSGVGLLPGKPAEFEIDASKCGAGDVVVTVEGPEGADPVKVEYGVTGDTPGIYTGAYFPKVNCLLLLTPYGLILELTIPKVNYLFLVTPRELNWI